MNDTTRALVEGWLSISGWLSGLILSGIGLSVTVVLLRATGKDAIEVKEVTIPLGKFWVIALAYTLGHLFLTWSFLRANDRIIQLADSDRTLAWDMLTVGNNLLFNGMEPRYMTKPRSVAGIPFNLYEMQWDPATVLSLGFCMVLFMALTYRTSLTGLDRFKVLLIAFWLCFANWIIGSYWSAAASANAA